MLAWKVLVIWLVMLICAVLNGALREFVLLENMPQAAALTTSGLVLCVLILVVALLLVPRLGPLTRTQSALIGLVWAGLTLVFEPAYARFMEERPWTALYEAYTFQDGNVWPLVLLVMLLAPLLAARLGSARSMARPT